MNSYEYNPMTYLDNEDLYENGIYNYEYWYPPAGYQRERNVRPNVELIEIDLSHQVPEYPTGYIYTPYIPLTIMTPTSGQTHFISSEEELLEKFGVPRKPKVQLPEHLFHIEE